MRTGCSDHDQAIVHDTLVELLRQCGLDVDGLAPAASAASAAGTLPLRLHVGVLGERDLTTYARGLAGALKVLGPTPRKQVLGMLCGLDLADEDARAVIHHGLARAILAEHGGRIGAGPEA